MERVESLQEIYGVNSRQSGMKARFTVGFLFDDTGDWTVLVKKRRPEWQLGYLNGLGGRIEPGETALQAMRRECIEEAGVDPEWSEYACAEYADHVLHFFAARDTAAYSDARAMTDEDLVRMPVAGTLMEVAQLIPNLRWLIPLARHHLFFEKVVLAHIIMSGSGAAIARIM